MIKDGLYPQSTSKSKGKEQVKTNIKSKLKPDIKMSEAYKLIAKIEENLLMEQIGDNMPLHDKN